MDLKEELKKILDNYALELNISDTENEFLSSLIYSVVKSEKDVRSLFYQKITDIIFDNILVYYDEKKNKLEAVLKKQENKKKKILN